MKSLKYLNKYLYKYRLRLSLGILFIIISNIFALYPAQIIRHAIDLIIETISIYNLFESFSLKENFYKSFINTLFLFGVTIILLAVLKGLFMFFMRQTIIVMSRFIEYDLKNEIYSHYQNLSLSFYRRNNTGDLITRISEDVNRVRMYIGPAIMYSINLLVLFILIVATMLSINPKLTFYILTPLPFLSLCIYYVNNIINKKSDKVQKQLSRLLTFVQETFSGIRIIKSYGKEKLFEEEFERESKIYMQKSTELAKVNAVFFPAIILLIGLSTLLTVFVGGKEAIAGNITLGNIAEFIIYVNMLTWPFATVGWVISLIQRAAASQERINEFLKTQPDIISVNYIQKEIVGNIEFKNVSFIYPDSGILALKDISFKIEPDKSLAILGKTGSGKSTIANLITRMYNVTAGEILIDGKNIEKINHKSLRDQIGYVPQDVFLFSDTIANNISFGLININADSKKLKIQIERAAEDAAIYDNIMSFPEKFETRIGERGITLSGGQKQRISIARAIIREPKILIFDDCLSAVDTQTEEKVLDNLKRIMKGKTSIIISHRVSSVKNADNIIVLDNGIIIEEGTHTYLMEKKGFYYNFYKKQLIEAEIN